MADEKNELSVTSEATEYVDKVEVGLPPCTVYFHKTTLHGMMVQSLAIIQKVFSRVKLYYLF